MARLVIVAAVLVCLSVFTQAMTLLGGLEDADVNSTLVKQAVSCALYEYNKASNDMYHTGVVKVHSAQKQIVSGIKVFLDVDIGRTQCKKPITDASGCKLHPDPNVAQIFACHFEVTQTPWKNKGECSVLKSNCP
ncbi:cystatin-like [Leptodactylus fuscus]|uniref:cystatin-like n=1 Tax=Leptodactylus fuscus TaxID=238119 RepID=UPI003F4E463F